MAARRASEGKGAVLRVPAVALNAVVRDQCGLLPEFGAVDIVEERSDFACSSTDLWSTTGSVPHGQFRIQLSATRPVARTMFSYLGHPALELDATVVTNNLRDYTSSSGS